MSSTLPIDCDRRLLVGFNYWRDRHLADGGLPGRQSIDPVDLRTILPFICLYDIQADPLRFRYRLVGTQVAARMDADFTGLWLDTVHPKFATSPAFDDFTGVVTKKQPLAYYRGQPQFHTEKPYANMERVLLPLARDGVTIDMILAVAVFGTVS